MKNNKGFTLIELAVSFCLVAAVSIILLQLVLTLKEVYLSGDVKTTLLNKQGIMTKKIYDDLNSKDLTSITSCGLSCLTFSYSDDTSANLLIDPGNKTVTYSDYTIQLDNSSYFDNFNVIIDEESTAVVSKDDSVIRIDIPIISKLLDNEDFGIHIVKTYNRTNTLININTELAATKVTLSGVDTNMTVLNNENAIKSIFIKLFHQEAGNYTKTFETFIKNKESAIFSTLTSLKAFKTKYNNDNVIEDLSIGLSEKETEKIKQTYQDGYYSLLLNYNNDDFSNNTYAWWYQTSDFSLKESIKGFSIYPEGNISTGITYNKDRAYWASTLDNKYTIGIKEGNILNNGAVATSVDLYAEARDYICKYSLSNLTYNGNNVKNLIVNNDHTGINESFCLED